MGALTVGYRRSIPLLPLRLVSLAGAVGTVQHPGQSPRHHLQTGWKISADELTEAKDLLSTLTSDLSPDAPFEVDDRVVPGHEAKGALLTKLIRGLGGAAEISDIVAAAKIEMYRDAIGDVPAWAIDLAIKRWARGSCPADIEEKPKFAFPPAPATLRGLALLELDLPRRYVSMLTNLIAAVPMMRALDPEPLPKSFGVGPALRSM